MGGDEPLEPLEEDDEGGGSWYSSSAFGTPLYSTSDQRPFFRVLAYAFGAASKSRSFNLPLNP